MTPYIVGQIPVVPQIEMPGTAQAVATAAIGIVAVLALVAALVVGRRHHTSLYVLVLIGGMVASINEPVVDILGGCLHPQTGGWQVFSTFDRPIPAWAVIAYALFFGAVPLVVLALLRGASPRKRFVQSVLVIFAANLLIELPILRANIYLYYGSQPFRIFGLFPLHWLFINGLGVGLIAVVLYRWPQLFKGPWLAAALALPTVAQLAAAAVGIPVFSAYNTEAGAVWKWIASAITMVFGAIAIYLVSRLLPAAADPAGASHVDHDESAPAVAAG